MEKLRIQIVDSPNIGKSLGISEQRGIEIHGALAAQIDSIFQGNSEGGRATDLAKAVIEQVDPNPNELFYIGIKIGEMVERQSLMSAIESASISKLSGTDLFNALLGSVAPE